MAKIYLDFYSEDTGACHLETELKAISFRFRDGFVIEGSMIRRVL